jgi:dipeptidyl aminopeptidase/acylaminoacyl peptidase
MKPDSARTAALLLCAVLLVTGANATAAQPPGAEVFGGLPGVQYVAISPNGRILATDRSAEAGTSVDIYDIAAAKLRRTIDIGSENKLRDFNWASDQILLVDISVTHTYGSSPSKMRTSEWERTLAIDVDDGTVRTMLLDDGNRKWVTGSTLYATRTGRADSVAMATWDHSFTRVSGVVDTRLGNDRGDSGWAYTLFDVNPRTGKGKPIAIGSPYTQDWAIDRQGQAVARSDWRAEISEFTILARDGAGWKEIYKSSDGGQLRLGGLSPDGRSVLAVGENGTDRSRIWAVALDGSGAKVFFEDPFTDIDGIKVDVTTGAPIGAYIGGLAGGLKYFDPKLQARQTALAKAFPDRRVAMIDRSDDGKRVIAKVDSPSHPAVFYLVDFTTGKADIAGESYPALSAATLGEVRPTRFAARDGTQIPAYLTLPPGRGDKNLPLVVLPHGGPESRDYDDFDWWPQFLATRGYAVLQPQFRGSTGFGSAFRVAGYRQWGGLMQDDVTDGVKAMISSGLADPARICIAGASYGGYAALAGATFTPDLYACAVSVNGVSDLPAMLGYRKRQGGSQSDQLAYWKDHIGAAHDPNVINRSPARAADNVKAPILLLHGADDTVVPISQAETMDRALTAAGKAHTFVQLAGEDHWLSRSASRTQILKEMEVFLSRHLGTTGP